MAFRKRDDFEDTAPPKNSYEAAARRRSKPLKNYDMRPHWIKNDTTTTTMNPHDEERAGADEEEAESLTLLKKEMEKTAYDDVMDIVLGSQEMIHSRAMNAHHDRMNILKQFCGYEVWEDAEKDDAPGAAKSVMVEVDEFNSEGATIKALDKTFISKDAVRQYQSKVASAGDQHSNVDTSSNFNNNNNNNGDAKNTTVTVSSRHSTAPTTTSDHNNNNNNPHQLHFSRGGLDQLDDDLTISNNSTRPLHVAILTPPFHGPIPLDHKHLTKGSLSYKMENAIGKMDEAVRHFQQVNEAVHEEMMGKAQAATHQHSHQHHQSAMMSSRNNNNKTPAGVNNSHQRKTATFATKNTSNNNKNDQQGSTPVAIETSKLIEQRMAREQRLEEGLFTAFYHQGGYSGLHGNPTSDPHARSPQRGANRRYPEPFAFVIH